jgi:hypothetical protein
LTKFELIFDENLEKEYLITLTQQMNEIEEDSSEIGSQ